MLLLGIIFGAMVGFAIAGAILSSACSLVRVQPPDFFFAMVLCFIVGVAIFIVQFLAGVAGTLGAGVSLASLTTVGDFQRLLERGAMFGVLTTPFVAAGIYSTALRECSFLRGLLVWLAQFVVAAFIILAIWAGCVALGFAKAPF